MRSPAREDLLTEIFVRDTEYRDVGDIGNLVDAALDLGRIDVDPSRDDHVALAVAQEEVAVFVEVTDVADREVALFVEGLLRLLFVALVFEVGGTHAHPHGAGLAGRHDVADVAVFGIPHEDLGEQILAVVEPLPGVAPDDALRDEIMTHVREKLGKYKWPRRIDFMDELPREPTGKLLKRTLRDPYWEGRDRAI